MVGERVSLSGAVNVTGVVEQLDFLQPVIRTDTHIPYTLPNKVRMLTCSSLIPRLISGSPEKA